MMQVRCSDARGRCDTLFFEERLLPTLHRRLLSAPPLSKALHVRFDFGELTWADLVEISSLAAIGSVLSARNFKITLRFVKTRRSKVALRHLSAAGFFAMATSLGLRVEVDEDETTDEHVLFRFLNVDTYAAKEDARSKIRKNIHYYYERDLPPDQIASFDKIVNEALENCLEHAYDPSDPAAPRLIAARRFSSKHFYDMTDAGIAGAYKPTRISYWLHPLLSANIGRDFIELSIVDTGVGIRRRIEAELAAHLRSQHAGIRDLVAADISDENALRFVLSRAKSTYTTDADDNIRGYGLYKLRDHVQAWNGLLYIRSGRTRFIYAPGADGPDIATKTFFPGTQIRVWLPVEDRSPFVRYVFAKESELL
jgi:hypothetical protein